MLCWMAASQFFLCLCKEGGEHKEDDVKVVKVVKVGESKVGKWLRVWRQRIRREVSSVAPISR